MLHSLRKNVYHQLYPGGKAGSGLSPTNLFLVFLILSSLILVVLETEPSIYLQRPRLFDSLDYLIGTAFAVEYLLRLWAAGEDQRFRGFGGRLRYALTPAALLDLLVVVPFFVMSLSPEFAKTSYSQLFLVRIVRVTRILALVKFGRYSQALFHIRVALWSRRFELLLSVAFMLSLLLVTSTTMYFIEGKVQPEHFGSIPRALWWGVVTLTTVGYGDAYPVTTMGKVCSGITALMGIGLIALPAGILASAFSDAFQEHKRTRARRSSRPAPQPDLLFAPDSSSEPQALVGTDVKTEVRP